MEMIVYISLRNNNIFSHFIFLLTQIMKKIGFGLLIFMLFSLQGYAVSEDDSIIEELNSNNTTQPQVDYSLESFQSCDAFEDVMQEYVKLYWENNYKNRDYRIYNDVLGQPMMESNQVASDSVS